MCKLARDAVGLYIWRVEREALGWRVEREADASGTRVCDFDRVGDAVGL